MHLDDSHISTSHRLSQSAKASVAGYPITLQQQSRRKAWQQPQPILEQFTNRDKRNQIFRRKLLRGNNEIKSIFSSKSVIIRENLTAKRNTLFDTAYVTKKDLDFKLLWTSHGKIKLRRDEQSKVVNITSISDLNK